MSRLPILDSPSGKGPRSSGCGHWGGGKKGIAGGDHKTDNNNDSKADGDENDAENSNSKRIVS